MFAVIFDEKFYFKIKSREIEGSGLNPQTYTKKDVVVKSNYFPIKLDCDLNVHKLVSLIHNIILFELSSDCQQEQRVKDMPNMTLKLERMLKNCRFTSRELLLKTGSTNAYLKLKEKYGVNVTDNTLLRIEGAIKGRHWSTIPLSVREDLYNRVA
ncbi:TfoX/Sxy family DNA transformation protein [Vibrio coralliirubri]|uniref:TfoX/Sxy family DNA transformation protein n=1 Tax=Vibrio coralliirubri TaxID=1516159 RepID=UPI002FD77E48